MTFQFVESKKTVFLILGIVCLLIYHQTFFSDWTYDDIYITVNNPDVTSLWNFLENSNPGRPLRELSFLIDYTIFGFNPSGWHIQQLLLHTLNAYFVYLLLLKLRAGAVGAFFCALVFLVHPLNVEVVAGISHRKDELALLFSLMSFFAYCKALDRGDRKFYFLILSFFFWLLAFYAKEISILLPLLFVAYEGLYADSDRKILYAKPRVFWWVICLGGAVFCVWVFWGGGSDRYHETARVFLDRRKYFGDAVFLTYCLLVLKSWAFMTLKVIWPFGLTLEYDYSIPQSVLDPWVISGFILVVLFVYGLYRLKDNKTAIFLMLWFFLFWLPTSNIWPLAYFSADRYYYTPGIGLFSLLCLYSVESIKSKKLTAIFIVCVVVALSVISFRQSLFWKNDETLYLRAISLYPKASFVYNELGRLYEKQGNIPQALKYYSLGYEANPKEAPLLYNFGLFYERYGFKDKALFYYEAFLAQKLKGDIADIADRLRARLKSEYGVSFPAGERPVNDGQ